MRLTLALPVVAVFALVFARAEAAPRDRSHDPDTSTQGNTRALELFEEGATAYREGRFHDSVDKLVEARKLTSEPVLLYNLARAYEALGRSVEAADAYDEYLAEAPGAADRKAIEGRVVMLRAQAAALAAARRNAAPRASAPEAPAASPQDRTSPMVLVPWFVAGAGVAAVATGIVFGALADGRHGEAADEPVQAIASDKQESAESLATAATVTIVVGAVVAAVGLSWLGARAATSGSVSTGGRRAPLLLGGTF